VSENFEFINTITEDDKENVVPRYNLPFGGTTTSHNRSLQTRNTDTDSDMNWYRYSYRKKSLTDISAKFRYEIGYELPSDLISEWFFATITVHIGVISEMHTPKLASKSQEQRKKPVGPDDFYVKRLSDMRSDMKSYRTSYQKAFSRAFPIQDRYEIYRTSYRKYYIVFITVYLYLKLYLSNIISYKAVTS
jgi:hypothetical protein